MQKPELKKYAVRFILAGSARTYVLEDLGSVDAICTALDLLEIDLPGVTLVNGLAIIVKAWPEGAHLAAEGEGPLLDTTRGLHAVPRTDERVAA
jgi:hypothetical protein